MEMRQEKKAKTMASGRLAATPKTMAKKTGAKGASKTMTRAKLTEKRMKVAKTMRS